jgi:hypothetical protein
VRADSVLLSNGSQISAQSTGSGNAGNIYITAASDLLIHDSVITTQADTAKGGNMKLSVGRTALLSDSEITTSVGSGAGDGGNISIDPIFVVLSHSAIAAKAAAGNGGNINIVTDYFISSEDSSIDASSGLGIDGTINIDALKTDVASGIAALPSGFFDASALLREPCAAARAAGRASSLLVVGRGGAPPLPDGYLPSFGLEDVGHPRSGNASAVPAPFSGEKALTGWGRDRLRLPQSDCRL